MRRVCGDPSTFEGFAATAGGGGDEAPDVLAMLQRDQLSPSRGFADVAAAYGLLNDPMLDDGCSTDGNQGLYFSRFFSGAVVGLQVRAGEAFAARTVGFPVATVARAAPKQRFVTTDGGPLPFDDGQFGSVFSQNVLEHAPDPELYIDEALRTLQDGGILFASWAPVWSSANGHHVQGHFGSGFDPRYKDDGSVIPPWGHLWLERGEMKRVFEHRKMNALFQDRVLEWIYDGATVSRRTFSEIDAAFARAAAKRKGHVVWSSCNLEGGAEDSHHRSVERAKTVEKLLKISAAQRLAAKNVTLDDLLASHCVFVVRKGGDPPDAAEAARACTLGTYSFHSPASVAQRACARAYHYGGGRRRRVDGAEFKLGAALAALPYAELRRRAADAGIDAAARQPDKWIGLLAAKYAAEGRSLPPRPVDARFRSNLDLWFNRVEPAPAAPARPRPPQKARSPTAVVLTRPTRSAAGTTAPWPRLYAALAVVAALTIF